MKDRIGLGKGIRPRVIVIVTLVSFILWLYPYTFTLSNLTASAPQIPVLLLPMILFLLRKDVQAFKRISIWDSVLSLSYLVLNMLAALTWGGRGKGLGSGSGRIDPLLVKLIGSDAGNFTVALYQPINAAFLIIWFICIVFALYEGKNAKNWLVLADISPVDSGTTRWSRNSNRKAAKHTQSQAESARGLAGTTAESSEAGAHLERAPDHRCAWLKHAAIPLVVLVLVAVLCFTLFFSFDKAPQRAESGQIWALGDAYPSADYENSLRLVPFISDAIAVSSSSTQVHAIAKDGTVWTFGGEMQIEPRKVPILSDIIEVQTHDDSIYAIRSDGVLFAWGDNYQGELGDGTELDRETPVTVSGITSVVHVWAGYDVAFALTKDGKLWGWGWNEYGQVDAESDEDSIKVPVLQTGLENVKTVVTSSLAPYVLTEGGAIYRWSKTDWGSVSDGTPQLLTGIPQMDALFGGNPYHSETDVLYGRTEVNFIFAIDVDGQVWAWEDNIANEKPVLIEGLPEIVAVATSNTDLYALSQDGSVWKFSDYGSNLIHKKQKPKQIAGLRNIVSISCSENGLYAVQGS